MQRRASVFVGVIYLAIVVAVFGFAGRAEADLTFLSSRFGVSGNAALLPSGLYQYTYQIFSPVFGFPGTFSIPDPGNVTRADLFAEGPTLVPCPLPPGQPPELCPNETMPTQQSIGDGMITWVFGTTGGVQIGTPPFGLITPDPPTEVQADVIFDNGSAGGLAIGMPYPPGPFRTGLCPFTVPGPAAPTPEPPSAVMLMLGAFVVLGIRLRRPEIEAPRTVT